MVYCWFEILGFWGWHLPGFISFSYHVCNILNKCPTSPSFPLGLSFFSFGLNIYNGLSTIFLSNPSLLLGFQQFFPLVEGYSLFQIFQSTGFIFSCITNAPLKHQPPSSASLGWLTSIHLTLGWILESHVKYSEYKFLFRYKQTTPQLNYFSLYNEVFFTFILKGF